jgi:hypothetical protein
VEAPSAGHILAQLEARGAAGPERDERRVVALAA